jgi:hypothetical protein
VAASDFNRIGTVLALAAALAVAFFGWASPARALTCETKVVHDYLRPVESFPPLRPIPATGNALPFGPASLHLESRRGSPAIREAKSSYLTLPGLRQTRYTLSREGESRDVRLNWLVTAKLVRLNRRGEASRMLGWSRRHIASLAPGQKASLQLPALDQAGFYRFEIAFRNGAGDPLGRFGEYARVLHPTRPEGRMTLNKTSFLPGEVVTAHVEQLGIGWIDMNDVYSIEVFDGSTWIRAPISPRELSLLIGTVVGPGEATSVSHFNAGAPCWGFTVPPGAAPGLYRFVIDGTSLKINENRLTRGSPLSLSAEFQILAG